MRTSELTGAALDWAVAKAIGEYKPVAVPSYSTDWAQGGPIIEREMIQLTPKCMVNPLHGWAAAYRSFDEDDDIYALHRMRGKTPLIAAMRCYVASKLGDNINIPEGLT
jgi:hypothetical protein